MSGGAGAGLNLDVASGNEASMHGGFGGIKFKESSSIDDIGILVVDGNFDLYGKMIFGNKQVLKALGYQAEDVLNHTVHKIMPKRIADVHNQFWRGFANAGEPKVLD